MPNYILHEGKDYDGVVLGDVSETAKLSAIGASKSNSSFFTEAKPATLVRREENDKHSVEFSGYKSIGDQQPVTVTSIVVDGKAIPLNKPVEVQFERSGEPTKASAEALEAICKGIQQSTNLGATSTISAQQLANVSTPETGRGSILS